MNPNNSNLSSHREKFPALANKAYFNYGGQGPLPQAALDAIYKSFQKIQTDGPFCGKIWPLVQEETNLTREAIASELNVSPETITLTEDVTVGCNIALWGIDWQPGDNVLLSDCEHPGIIAAIGEIQRRFNLEVSVFPLMETLNEGDPVAAIEKHLKPNTKLLAISHILWNTGQVLPLADIVKVCHQNGERPVKVLVDAAQSVGVLPLNLAETGVDFYAFTGHKWLCGPEGVGGLYVSPEARKDLSPTFIGWRGITVSKNGQPTGFKTGGQRYEIATSATPLYKGLQEAIALHRSWGTAEERYEQIKQLSAYLWQGLSEINNVNCLRKTPPEAGLVSFTLTNGKPHKDLVDFLESRGIMVRTILDPDCVRASVHYLTLESEIDRLIAAVKEYS